MKHVRAAIAQTLIITAPICGAAEPPSRFVIEQSCTADLPPLDAEEMQRLAQGTPPRLRSCQSLANEHSGFFFFRCNNTHDYDAPGGYSSHPTDSLLQFLFTQNVKFTVANLLIPIEAEGMRVLRGPDGGIQQMATMKACYFIHQDKDMIVTERYFAFDCETTPDGRMKTLPEAVCNSRFKVREQAPEPAKGMRTFEVKVFDAKQEPLTFVIELQETKGRCQVVGHYYKGDKISPETLKSQDSLQRVFWKEGPGYRQITKVEVRQPDGTLQLKEHTMTNWRVEKDGSRKLVDTQDLRTPPRRKDVENIQ